MLQNQNGIISGANILGKSIDRFQRPFCTRECERRRRYAARASRACAQSPARGSDRSEEATVGYDEDAMLSLNSSRRTLHHTNASDPHKIPILEPRRTGIDGAYTRGKEPEKRPYVPFSHECQVLWGIEVYTRF